MRTLAWSEPRWSFNPSYRAELREAGLTPAFFLRIFILGAALSLACAIPVYLLIPAFAPPPGAFLAVPFVVPAYLVLNFGLHACVSRTIRIRSDRIDILHGGSGVRIKPDRILSAEIDTSDPDRPILHIRYLTHRAKERSRSVGIAPPIDLLLLEDALAELRSSSVPALL